MIRPEILMIIGDFLDSHRLYLSDTNHRNQTYSVRNTPEMVDFLTKAYEYSNYVPVFEYTFGKKYFLVSTNVILIYLIHLLHEQSNAIIAEEADQL